MECLNQNTCVSSILNEATQSSFFSLSVTTDKSLPNFS